MLKRDSPTLGVGEDMNAGDEKVGKGMGNGYRMGIGVGIGAVWVMGKRV